MSANVTLAGVELTRVNPIGRKPEYQYDGTVRLEAKSAQISFGYAYNFTNADSVPNAIELAVMSLKSELEALAKAAPKAVQTPRSEPEEGAEGLDD